MQVVLPQAIIMNANPSKDGSKVYLSIYEKSANGRTNEFSATCSGVPVEEFRKHGINPVKITGVLDGRVYANADGKGGVRSAQVLTFAQINIASPLAK